MSTSKSVFLGLLLSLLSHKSFCQIITDSIKIEEHYRVFHYPTTKIQKKASLIFVLHGSGGTGWNMMTVTDSLEKICEKENILLVYPDGYKHFWNECRKASTAAANVENINEELFFKSMIQFFTKKYKVDTKKIFVIGMSGGGHMAYKLAITMPDKIKGIAAVVASLPSPENMDCAEQKKPMAVMIINGTADGVSPYAGGPLNVQNVILGNVRSTEASFDYWAQLSDYGPVHAVQSIPDKDTTDQITIEKHSFESKEKPDIVLFKIYNGKHEFPKDINACVEAWWFFKKQIPKKRYKR